MIKKILLAVAMVLPMFAFAQAPVKIGVVDISSIIQAMPETQAAQTKVADTSKKYEEAYAKLIEEYKKLTEELKGAENQPAALQEKAISDVQDKQVKIQQFEQKAQEDLQRQQQELMAPIMEKVRQAIEAIGKEGKFTTISEKPAYIYIGTDVIDITADVKARLGIK